jgi:hypothetical protein
MRNKIQLLSLPLVLGLCVGLQSCDDERHDSLRDDAEDVMDDVEDGAEEAVDEVQKAADDLDDGR